MLAKELNELRIVLVALLMQRSGENVLTGVSIELFLIGLVLQATVD